jgi:flagella basal body P-ring formation protein FlgA
VATTHSLPRGTVLREGDVEIQHDPAVESGPGLFHTLEEVIGRETTRSIAAGKPVSADDLRSPLIVHRGDVVTVHANTAGIRIRTNARARDDGSQGDLVAVESLLDHSTYYARVSGIREVEVYARATRVESAATDEPRGFGRR